jgi:hypothetical protein
MIFGAEVWGLGLQGGIFTDCRGDRQKLSGSVTGRIPQESFLGKIGKGISRCSKSKFTPRQGCGA